MKHIIVSLICLLGLGLTGCSNLGAGTLGNGKIDNPLAFTPYEIGYAFVTVDTITDPFQSEEIGFVVDRVYALAAAYGGSSSSAEIVKELIDRQWADATPEFRAQIFAVYDLMTLKLRGQLETSDLPKFEIFSEFHRGMNDALLRQRNAEPTITELLDDMAEVGGESDGDK